jgi:hypothetical protein
MFLANRIISTDLRWHISQGNKPVIHRIVYDRHGCFTDFIPASHKGLMIPITSIVIKWNTE